MPSLNADHLKLFYLNGRGRAELIRLILAAAGKKSGVDFDDIRCEMADWEKFKDASPFKALPYLELPNGEKIAESLVIARYLANKLGLAGADYQQQLAADMIATALRNIFDYLIRITFEEKDASRKNELVGNLKSKLLPNLLTELSKRASDHKFFLGDQLSWADLAFYDTISAVESVCPDVLSCYKNLQLVYKHVEEEPAVKAWLGSRPQTPF